MSARSVAATWAASALLMAAQAYADDPAPAPIVTAGQVVAVAPLFVEPFDPDRDRAFAVTDAIERYLADRGLTVVSAREFEQYSTPKIQEIGGYFDPYTGERIDEKYRAVREYVYGKLAETHKVDAYLYPRVVVVEAMQKGTSAEWDGTKVKLLEGFLNLMLNNASNQRSIDALTLRATLRDAQDATLYEGRGGLELLVRHGKQGYENLGPDDVLHDAAANQHAVEVALEDLVPPKPKR